MILTFWILKHDQILGVKGLVNGPALLRFISNCQFRFGGISKAPGEDPGKYVVERSEVTNENGRPIPHVSVASCSVYVQGRK